MLQRTDRAIRYDVPEKSWTGTRLFQWLALAKTGGRRRRRHLAVRTCAAKMQPPFSAIKISRNHTSIPRSDDRCDQTLELRFCLIGRSLPQGSDAGRTAPVRLPDIRRGI